MLLARKQFFCLTPCEAVIKRYSYWQTGGAVLLPVPPRLNIRMLIHQGGVRSSAPRFFSKRKCRILTR